MVADVPTVAELAERIRAVVSVEMGKLERAAADAPLSEPEARKLRELAGALRLAAIADPASRKRKAWFGPVPPPMPPAARGDANE